MFQFNVSYYEVTKPTGKRSHIGIYPNYEEVLFNGVLETIHRQATNGYDYDWPFLNHSVFIQRANVNSMICEYKVQIHHPIKWGKIMGNYKIEIECEIPPRTEEEREILFEQHYPTGKTYIAPQPKKTKQMPTWLKSESRAVRWFLFDLHRVGSLKELKKELTNSRYHRNLKICEEKGYIVNGKLVKRVWVTKFDSK